MVYPFRITPYTTFLPAPAPRQCGDFSCSKITTVIQRQEADRTRILSPLPGAAFRHHGTAALSLTFPDNYHRIDNSVLTRPFSKNPKKSAQKDVSRSPWQLPMFSA